MDLWILNYPSNPPLPPTLEKKIQENGKEDFFFPL